MKITLDQELSGSNMMQEISWFGETDHDMAAVEKLKELDGFLADVIQRVYFLQKETQQIADNQHNASARQISEESKKVLRHIVEMATDEEQWKKIEKLFSD